MTIPTRIRALITRAKITLAVLGQRRTMVQVAGLRGMVKGSVELLLPYGMSALPLPGGDIVLVQILGAADHVVAFPGDDASLRIADLQPGEFGFRDQHGQQVVFRQSHIEMTGNLQVNGSIAATGDIVGAGKSLDHHVHSGVQPGGGNTGQPV